MSRLIDVVEDGIVIGLLFDATGTEDERFHFDRRRRRIARGDDANRRKRRIGCDQTLNEIMIGEDLLDDPIAVIPRRKTQQRSLIPRLSLSLEDVRGEVVVDMNSHSSFDGFMFDHQAWDVQNGCHWDL